MKKALRETQTLGAGCSVAEPKIFAPPRGAVGPKFNQLEMVIILHLQTQFGKDRCTQFRGYRGNRPTKPQTHKHTNRQDRLQYIAPLASAQYNYRSAKRRRLY